MGLVDEVFDARGEPARGLPAVEWEMGCAGSHGEMIAGQRVEGKVRRMLPKGEYDNGVRWERRKSGTGGDGGSVEVTCGAGSVRGDRRRRAQGGSRARVP
ncbi:MAG: hypothetical protein MUQ65_10035 [Armatimonadetes bacterium]|nr:hypothetical protein [Armatimonadota bacterium]